MKTILLISSRSSDNGVFDDILGMAGYTLVTASAQQLLLNPDDFPLPDAVILPYNWENELAFRGFQISRTCNCDQIPLIVVGNRLPDFVFNQNNVIGSFLTFPLAAQLVQVFRNALPN